MAEELVTLTIDGREIQVAQNTLLVEAAAQAGILVPVYCYHPKLAPVGACRMCLVEVEGAPKLIASCTTPVKEGMVVHTQNRRVEKARQGVLEFLLIHHPLDCPVCDKGGECPLQDFTYEFGPSRSRFRYPKRHWDKPIQIGKNILLDRERCIMCFRCVRFGQEISFHPELDAFKRGNSQEIGTAPGHPFNSQFSGNTIELCPVGALTGAPTRFYGRTWDTFQTPSVCTRCAAGCNIRVDKRQEQNIVRLWSRENPHTDDGWLCDYGRFGYHFVNDNRLEDPQVRSGDRLATATWQQATAKAGAILQEHSRAGTLGVLVSPRLTNEELYSISRFTRTVLGTNNLDHTCRYVHPEAVDLYGAARDAGFADGVLRDIEAASQIITIGVDLSREQPVTELRVKKAVSKNGARLVVLDGEEMELSAFAEHSFLWSAGAEADTISRLAQAVSGADACDAAFSDAGKLLREEGSKVVVIGWRLAESRNAANILKALGELAKSLGQDVPCVVIVRHCNSRGALDLGIAPSLLPARRPVGDGGGRQLVRDAWNGDVPGEAGMGGEEMLQAAADGRLKALWLVGEEPLLDADPELVRAALSKVEALVYQGWSVPLSVTRTPDVVLAAQTFAEQDGTFTNTHGRVQRIYQAIRARGRARSAWDIVSDLSRALGHPFALQSATDIWSDIVQVVPQYGGITWGRLGSVGKDSSAELVTAGPVESQ